MTSRNDSEKEPVLDNDMLETLGRSGCSADDALFSAQREDALEATILARIDAESLATESGLVTVRDYDGAWEQIAPKIEKKVLRVDTGQGTESYLLRVEPGAEAPPHRHETDEICIMLAGEVRYDNFHLCAGDYHFAPRGSVHGRAHSETGALLFIHAGINSQAPV